MQKETYYQLALGVGIASLGLATYNTIMQAKERKALEEKGVLGFGGFGEASDDLNKIPTMTSDQFDDGSYFSLDSSFNTIHTIADSYADRGTATIQSLINNQSIQDSLKKAGIQLSAESLTKERIKSMLAAYGLLQFFLLAKSNALKLGVLTAAFLLYSQNRQKIQLALSEVLGENSSVA